MIIYLVRHGETDWNKVGKLQGQCDVPLNKYGISLAEKTADGLAGVPLEDFWRIAMPNCAVSLLSLEGGRFTILEESRVYYEGAVRPRP